MPVYLPGLTFGGLGYGGASYGYSPYGAGVFPRLPVPVTGGYGGAPYGLASYGSVDITPPRVTGATSLDGYRVEVFFNEDMLQGTQPSPTPPRMPSLRPRVEHRPSVRLSPLLRWCWARLLAWASPQSLSPTRDQPSGVSTPSPSLGRRTSQGTQLDHPRPTVPSSMPSGITLAVSRPAFLHRMTGARYFSWISVSALLCLRASRRRC